MSSVAAKQEEKGTAAAESSSWLQGWAQLLLAINSLVNRGSQSGFSPPPNGLKIEFRGVHELGGKNYIIGNKPR